jgi:hypothetical protein
MNTFSTGNFYLGAYLMTTMNASVPEIYRNDQGGVTLIFPDESGELAWAAEAFALDKTVQKFCNSLRRINTLLKGNRLN